MTPDTVTAPSPFLPEPLPRMSPLSRAGLVAMTLARLTLGLGMIPYGMSKLFGLQFQVGASSYAETLGNTSGIVLTWAFLGYSPAFQFLLGVCETIPALLLLSARTRRLGALLLFPVVLNVTLFNFFLDLWPGTRAISAFFLALNIFLLAYDYPLYLNFAGKLIAAPRPIANRRLRLTANATAFLVPIALMAAFFFSFYSDVARELSPFADFIGERQINRAGTWKIESLRVSGKPVAVPTEALLYFDFNRKYIYGDGKGKTRGKFEANKAAHTFKLQNVPFVPGTAETSGAYRVDRDRLFLDGLNAGQPVAMVLRRERWGHIGK